MRAFNITIAVALSFFAAMPVQAERVGEYWIVKGGDTLYGIARTIYPKDTSKRSKLRREIIQINQVIFLKGPGSLYVGAKLKLPEYVIADTQGAPSVFISDSKKKTPASQVKHESIQGKVWKVKYGETLYSISRKVYPGSGKKQYRLRQDIVKLNPAVFSGGRSRMEIGQLLTLPDYVTGSKKQLVTPVQKSQPKLTRDVQKPSTPKRVEKKPVEIKTEQPEQETLRDEVSDDDYGLYSSSVSLNIGFSLGGDIAFVNIGGRDISYGSGAHLRFSYDGLWENRKGYRLALGYQLHTIDAGSDNGQLEQNYLQGLYLYNTSSSLFGVGLAYHYGVLRSSDIGGVITESEYDPAFGIVLAYEYKRLFGKHIVGISHTTLDSQHSVSNLKVDMTRTELYYRWQF